MRCTPVYERRLKTCWLAAWSSAFIGRFGLKKAGRERQSLRLRNWFKSFNGSLTGSRDVTSITWSRSPKYHYKTCVGNGGPMHQEITKVQTQREKGTNIRTTWTDSLDYSLIIFPPFLPSWKNIFPYLSSIICEAWICDFLRSMGY